MGLTREIEKAKFYTNIPFNPLIATLILVPVLGLV